MRQFNFTWTTIGWLIGYGLFFIPSLTQIEIDLDISIMVNTHSNLYFCCNPSHLGGI